MQQLGLYDTPELRPCMFEAWPFQRESIDAIFAALRRYDRVLANLFTGAGKCVDPDTLIWSDGLRRFGDAWDADRIMGPHGIATVAGWYDDGTRPGLKATLACGLEIDGTLLHRVWVRYSDGIEGWKAMADLQPGDYVAVARGQADFGRDCLSASDAYLLGLVVADGCLVKNCSWRLQIDKQRPVLECIAGTALRWKLWSGGNGDEPRIKDVSPGHAVIEIHSVGMQQFLSDRFGLDFPAPSEERVVPRRVLGGDRTTVRAFLRGYFDGDGYCSPGPACSTSSPRLASQVHQLLLGLGVFASRRLKIIKGGLPAHIIEINDIEAFRREVGFTRYGLTKDVAFESLLSKKRNTNIDTVPWAGDLFRRAAKHVPNKHKRDDAWRRIGAYYDGKKKPSYALLRSLIPGLPAGVPERAELQRIVDEHRIWSPVESIGPSTIRRIDCEVAEQHAFVGNGIINHNTVLASLLCRRGVEAGRKILFLVPTIELAQQTAEKFDMAGMTAMIEQAGQRARKLFEPHVVVGSLMTMKDVKRLESFGPDYFNLVVVDEAHMAPTESCKRVLAYFRKAKVVGLTATIKRADEKDLGHIFDAVAYRFTLIDAWKAPEPGPYACDIVPIKCDLDIDLRKLKPAKGDFTDRDLDTRIGPMVELMANKVREKIEGRRTLVFLPSIRSSQVMAEALCKLGLAAEAVWGSDPDRAAKIRRYQSGETQVLCNMNLLTTGFDVPETSAIVLARPTRSHTLYLQMIGRGTRVNKAERECLLVDFGWLTDDFPPVQSSELLDSPGFDAEAAEIAKELIAATPGLSLKDAIEQAEVESEERKRRKKEYAVRVSIQERQVVCDEETYSMKEAFAEGADATPRTWNMPSPGVKKGSPAQVAVLKQWGYADADNWSIYKVRQTFASHNAQRARGKSTIGQRDAMARKGIPVQVGREMSREAAEATLSQWGDDRRAEVYGRRGSR